MMQFTVDETGKGKRLDSWLASQSDLSRSFIQKLAQDQMIFVTGNHPKSA